jgi:hypothetical protein
MGHADPIHYKLLQAELDLCASAVGGGRSVSERMQASVRLSVESARRASVLAGDHELTNLCDVAELKLSSGRGANRD